MKRFLALIKKDILSSYPYLLQPGKALADKKLRKKLLIQVFALALIVFYGSVLLKPIFALYQVFEDQDLSLAYLALGFTSFGFVTLLFSFPYVISKIYLSGDVRNMMSLPLEAWEILLSKLLALAFSSLFYGVFTAAPFLVKYGWALRKGPIYYIYGLVGLILVGLGFVSLLALVAIVLMSLFSRMPRMRNFLQSLGMILIMVLSFGINYFIQSQAQGDASQVMEKIATSSKGLLEVLLPALPNVRWLLLALESSSKLSGLFYFLLLFIVSALLALFIARLAAPLMVKGVLATAISPQRKNKKRVARKAAGGSLPVYIHIFKKEFIELVKTPLYFFNTLGGGLILPIALFIPLFAQGALTKDSLIGLRHLIPMLPLFPGEKFALALVIGLGLGLVLGSMGGPLSSTFSREGRHIWIIKMLPIEKKDHILGRLLLALSFQFILLLPVSLISWFLLKPPLSLMLALFLGGLLAGAFTGLFGMAVDATRPKLVWDNPQEAMKQNMNLVITLFSSWALAGGLGYLGYKLYESFDLELVLVSLLLVLGIVIISALLIYYLFKNLDRLIFRMED